MTPDRYRKIRTLFDQICQLPPEERAHALDKACAGDLGLRAETERLLGHDEQPAAFLSMPLFEGGAVHGEDDQGDDEEPLPEIIADCRVLRVIGRGGMGTVYLAEEQQPRREVAIKVMRAGFLSTAARRRFKFEAELLANLTHPGIAQVYRADIHVAADRRVPYFVMEYIREARTILAYAKERDLDLRACLELFAKVCDAVQFAHQNGVIHRDLKPGNILVDSSGRPRVIDFGAARVFETEGGIPRTPPTEHGQQFGTPEYMSPEQCAGGSRDVDVRSDVYSLGVVLYELLTGVMPYER